MFSYGFYNSLNGDRRYNAEQMSSIFDGIIEDGVFANVGEALAVVPGSGLQIVVKTGRAWFKHTWNLNDSWLPINLEAADALRPRIDSVVLEVNSNLEVRENSIKIVKGTAKNPAEPPAMVHADGVDQYRLADVTVQPAATGISEADITIKVGQGDTPFVTAPLQSVDITALFNQWNGEFTEWFDNLKLQLTDNVVANLQNQINNKVDLASKATAEDLANATPNKWVDAQLAKENLFYLDQLEIGDITFSTRNLEELTGGKFVACDQRAVKASELPEVVRERYKHRLKLRSRIINVDTSSENYPANGFDIPTRMFLETPILDEKLISYYNGAIYFIDTDSLDFTKTTAGIVNRSYLNASKYVYLDKPAGIMYYWGGPDDGGFSVVKINLRTGAVKENYLGKSSSFSTTDPSWVHGSGDNFVFGWIHSSQYYVVDANLTIKVDRGSIPLFESHTILNYGPAYIPNSSNYVSDKKERPFAYDMQYDSFGNIYFARRTRKGSDRSGWTIFKSTDGMSWAPFYFTEFDTDTNYVSAMFGIVDNVAYLILSSSKYTYPSMRFKIDCATGLEIERVHLKLSNASGASDSTASVVCAGLYGKELYLLWTYGSFKKYPLAKYNIDSSDWEVRMMSPERVRYGEVDKFFYAGFLVNGVSAPTFVPEVGILPLNLLSSIPPNDGSLNSNSPGPYVNSRSEYRIEARDISKAASASGGAIVYGVPQLYTWYGDYTDYDATYGDIAYGLYYDKKLVCVSDSNLWIYYFDRIMLPCIENGYIKLSD